MARSPRRLRSRFGIRSIERSPSRSKPPVLLDPGSWTATNSSHGRPFTSRTPPPPIFRVHSGSSPPAPLEIESGGRAIVELDVLADAVQSPPPPPEIRITASFRDHQDRVVPIVLPRRIPVTRFDSDATDGTPGWPIAACLDPLRLRGTRTTWDDGHDGRSGIRRPHGRA